MRMYKIFWIPRFCLFSDVTEQLSQLREAQSKQQQELSKKRSVIDGLSAQMSNLARHHKELRSKQKCMNESLKRISEVVAKLKFDIY